jgi:cyclopropane fatty-acyl-phospholipid synthase-like methyltransferase
MSSFDPVKYKQTTEQQWQDAAEAWHRWGPTLGAWLGPATEEMLRMARIGPGSRVLDVAAGAGEQTIAAAKRVGRTQDAIRSATTGSSAWTAALAERPRPQENGDVVSDPIG